MSRRASFSLLSRAKLRPRTCSPRLFTTRPGASTLNLTAQQRSTFSSSSKAEVTHQNGARSWTLIVAAATALCIASFGAGALLFKPSSSSNHSTSRLGAPISYASHSEMLAAADEIAQLLGSDWVSFDSDVLEHHGYSEWSTSNSPVRAVAVVYPKSTADVSNIARVCTKWRVPMIPYGAGSSVEGNASQPHSGICINLSLMDKIVEFHPEDMDVVVQPGVNWVDLNARIAHAGLFAPLDPSPTATIGGMVSTNCSGTNAMRYGTMKDWVLSVTVVMPDGTVVKTRRRPRKTSAGYNLTSLFVGAEGTLGIVTEATLKLAPIPQDTRVAAVAFGSIREAAAAASKLIRSGIPLAALELMDDVQMKMLNEHGSEAVRKWNWAEKPTLFIRFSGTTEAVESDARRASEMVRQLTRGSSEFRFARSKQDETDLWAARKEALFTMLRIRPEGTEIWSTDVAVPLSRLAEIIDLSKKECGQLGIFASVIGHVGDGNFHVAMMYDPQDTNQKQAVAKCVQNMMRRAIDMGGTVSGEHAIGIGKKQCLVDELGQDTINLMRDLKRAVDPLGIMNPGKVFDLTT
ncbi:d-lactate dehydrogenase [Diplogelasinospora grovesii]|uniref:D-lactate dehydrogenase (cytochrome) n=1 Tax=Diplogelasinospora grovesii TaxID=303347 RepID=A0AAN6RZY1_9PEZI|nr:d-lactate dehydrogenase [Diplogelasinospora grovesii]